MCVCVCVCILHGELKKVGTIYLHNGAYSWEADLELENEVH